MILGEWDGKLISDIHREHPILVDNIYRQPENFHPPQGETLQHFRQRLGLALNTTLNHFKSKHIAVITHAGVIKCILSLLLKNSFDTMHRVNISYGSVTRVAFYSNETDTPLTESNSINPELTFIEFINQCP